MTNKMPDSTLQETNRRKAPAREYLTKFIATLAEEFQNVHPRLLIANLIFAPLPPFVGGRLRTFGLRAAGFDIGRGSLFWGMPTITGPGKIASRLHIGEGCLFNFGCVFDLTGSIAIGHRVGVGHQVLIMTGSHQIGSRACRAGELTTAPVTIEDGAWIGSRSIILPGVTIGAGAVIGAGTLVSRDIPADMLISGEQRISLAKWR